MVFLNLIILCVHVYNILYVYHLVTTVSFEQSTYRVNENDGLVQITLILSNPSSSNITVQVTSNDNTAKGIYYHYHSYA